MTDAPALPPECDTGFYLATQPDLAGMDAAQAAAHFERYGSAEGRTASPAAVREGFLAEVVYRHRGDLLEIGPFCSPLLKGPSVSYLDVQDADGLRVRAAEHGIDASQCPETIHFVCDLERVDARFDAVFASHVIEHQPDLIRHLREVGRVLKPGGRYYFIVADKRYCFDALMAESSVADLYQAYHEGRRQHAAASVVEHLALTTHNDPARHWNGDHGGVDPVELPARMAAAIQAHDGAGQGYLDVHAWRFTPHGFRTTIAALRALALIPLAPVRVYATPRGRLEFCAVLERD